MTFDYAGFFVRVYRQHKAEQAAAAIATECAIAGEQAELQTAWDALQATPAYVERFKQYQPLITESLGAERAVELDPATGVVTILDAERGVQLTALQALVLCGFLKEHEQTIGAAAYAALERKE